jgi:hypothetical protein
MTSRVPNWAKLPLWGSLVLGIGFGSGAASLADDGLAHHEQCSSSAGTLGYGGYGPYPGYQGFALKYHPGYGYGGRSLGVGIYGGYPFYGGPGYPCVEPTLNRCGKITPFPFNGGPGYPRFGYSNYFGEVGPLVANAPVAIINAPEYSGNFGPYSGVLPYPEAYFAPYSSAAAATGSSTGTSPAPAPSSAPN